MLVGKIDPQETPVGLVIAAVAAVGAVSALAVRGDRYAVPIAAVAALPKLAVSVVGDTFVVTGALVRALGGRPPDDRIEEMPLDAGGGDDARSAGARALTVASTSAAPNSIVVDVDRERGVLLVHRLT